MFNKIISLILSISLILTQPIFAQGVAELNIGKYLNQMPAVKPDSFRPAHLRYISYDIKADSFQLLLDKGESPKLQDATQELFNYFLIGLSLPNEKFWVNLRPDAPQQIIDPELEKTDMGKIMLEADLQLKKDTAGWTSPQNPQGKEYWDKLYKRAGELFGNENITIPTITRPWIVPGEVIIREGEEEAYIYKANLKVMLEEDYLRGTKEDGRGTIIDYSFNDPRLKELNKYSTQLIKELILPKLTQEINTSKKYAQLRQVFFSLILSRWFKDKYKGKPGQYYSLIDSRNLDKLSSKESWSKDYYFSEYKKSFEQGEYNLKEQITTPTGQVIRSYVSGGIRPIPDNISSFVSAGTSSPIDWNLLIPIATTIAIAGGIYTMYLLQRGSIVASHQKESIKFMAIRYDIQYILKHYVYSKSLAQDDAVVVKKIFSDYKGFTLEETIAAVKYIVLLLKVSRQLSDETQRKAREKVIAILESSLQTIDKIIGSSPLTPVQVANRELKGYFNNLVNQYRYQYGNVKNPEWRKIYRGSFIYVDLPVENKKDLIVLKKGIANFGIIVESINDQKLKAQAAELVAKFNAWAAALEADFGASSPLNTSEVAKEFYTAYIVKGGYKKHPSFSKALSAQDMENVLISILKNHMSLNYGDTANSVRNAREIIKKHFNIELDPAFSSINLKSFIIRLKDDVKVSSALTKTEAVPTQMAETRGGIDFTQINYLARPMGSFQGLDLRLPLLSKAELEGIDINKELASVEQMVNAKIDVSTDRLKRLLAAMSQKDAFNAQREIQLLPLLLRLCWLKEERGVETTPDFRAVLLIADTGLFVEQGTS